MVNLLSKEDAAANQATSQQAQADMDAKARAGMGDTVLNMKVGQVGDYAQDRLKVLFDPNDGATGIFGVARYTEYGPGKQPVTATMVDALTEKYGPPSRTGGDRRTVLNLAWLEPEALARPASSLTHCYNETGVQMLYEDIGDGGYAGDRWMVNATSENFVRAVNLIASRNPFTNVAGCGTVLQVRLKLTNNGDYVGGMNIRLLDLTGGYNALNQFGSVFAAQAQGARQQQIRRDSANKPRL